MADPIETVFTPLSDEQIEALADRICSIFYGTPSVNGTDVLDEVA